MKRVQEAQNESKEKDEALLFGSDASVFKGASDEKKSFGLVDRQAALPILGNVSENNKGSSI